MDDDRYAAERRLRQLLQKQVARGPCSSCRRRRSAAKQSQTGVAMHLAGNPDEWMTTAARPNAGFASCYKSKSPAGPVAAAEGGVRLRSSRRPALQCI